MAMSPAERTILTDLGVLLTYGLLLCFLASALLTDGLVVD